MERDKGGNKEGVYHEMNVQEEKEKENKERER